MADTAVASLNSLLRSTGIEDHNEALRLANAALQGSGPSNSQALQTAQHTKVVALLKLDRYDDVLRVISGGGDQLAHTCALENAYSLYKTGHLDEADSVCRGLQNRAARHISAQVAYRADRFDDAARIYRDLADTAPADGRAGEEGDLRINMLAAAAQMEWSGRAPQHQDVRIDAGSRHQGQSWGENFETVYNAACASLARGDLVDAVQLLRRAKEQCEASEELSTEERGSELVPILVQLTYALVKLGRVEEAAQLQESISIPQIPDAATKLVAQNNSLVLSQQAGSDGGGHALYNPYLAARLAESQQQPTGNNRLFEHQAAVLSRNKHIIELQCQKFDGVRTRTAAALKSKNAAAAATSEAANLGVLHAAAVAHLQTGKEALRSILPLLESRPDDIGLLLTIIQLYVQIKNPGPALSLLEALFRRLEAATSRDQADVRFSPGLVALAVALYRLQGRHSAVRTELAKAAAHWQQASTAGRAEGGGEGSSGSAFSLLRQAGIELLQSSDPADLATTGAAFSRLCAEQPGDRLAEAGLVASFATSSSERSRVPQSYLDHMTPIEQLTAGVDVQALVDAGVTSLPAAATAAPSSAAGKKRSAAADATGQQQAPPAKKPRQRKSKLPKDLDPDKKPDPERWLPLRDRSSYRPKGGKKGKKRAEANTQGGVVRGEQQETLELVGGAGAVKVEKAPQGGGGAAKKKKKGKK